MEEEGPAKKKSRYSREPDLEVVVEEEVFRVHSRDLMAASDVFASMLENGMRESEAGQVLLEGKSKEEFRTLLKYICVERGEAFPEIQTKNVELLLKWADEYQITGLVSRCEKFLMAELCECGEKDVVGRLHLAIEYQLVVLRDEAAKMLADRIFQHRHDVLQFVENPSVMRVLLPQMYKEAQLEPPTDLPSGALEVKDIWPLVARCLEVMRGWKKVEDCHTHAKMYRDVVSAAFDCIPQQKEFSDPRPEGRSMEELKKMLMTRFGGEYVQKAVLALEAASSVSRHAGTGKYYRQWLARNRVFGDW